MSSAVSLPNHTFTGQAKSSYRLTSIVHILSPETDNCPSWIRGRERMTEENISWSISTKECCRLGGGWTHDLLVSSRTAHPTEPPRLAGFCRSQLIWIYTVCKDRVYRGSEEHVLIYFCPMDSNHNFFFNVHFQQTGCLDSFYYFHVL